MPNNRTNNKRCHFQLEWLDSKLHPDFFLIRKPCTASETDAFCILCLAHFDISNMGISAVRSHGKRKKHLQRVAAKMRSKQMFPVSVSKTGVEEVSDKVSNCTVELDVGNSPNNLDHLKTLKQRTQDNIITNYISKNDVMKAEILWALQYVFKQSYARSFNDSSELFPLMFPDSDIAKKFQMKKDKLGYVITYGLGPYFQNQLAKIIRECDIYAVSFDESLNKISQKGQMDLIIRFWRNNEVNTRYLTSTFLGHATAADLLMVFTTVFKEHSLNLKNMLQVSMDGPNVNKKFLKDLISYLNDSQDYPEIVDIGTCVLHIVNNSYKTAHTATDWDISQFLRSIYNFFKDFPTRRADFTHYTHSSEFPLKFCSTRWLENSKVMERAMKILSPLRIYVKSVEKNPPNSDNYEKMKNFLNDELLDSKLGFLISISVELEPFLGKYQTDWPMLPFMRNDLYNLMKDFISKVVKASVMTNVKTVTNLLEIDWKKRII